MNDLFSGSFSRFRSQDQSPDSHSIEMTNSTGGVNLDKFFEDVEAIKDELKDLETLYSQLHSSNEQSKTLHNAKAVKELRTKMDNDVSLSLKKAKFIKVRLEALDRSNAANRSIPGCGPGSSSDRTRTSVVNGLRKKLQDQMNLFNDLRQKMAGAFIQPFGAESASASSLNFSSSNASVPSLHFICISESLHSKILHSFALGAMGFHGVKSHLNVLCTMHHPLVHKKEKKKGNNR